MLSGTRDTTAARMTVIGVYNETGNVIETHEHAGADSRDGKIYQKSSFSDDKTARGKQ